MTLGCKVLLLVGGSARYHDTPEHRSLLSTLLSQSGTNEVTATDDMTALDAANLAAYDVIVNYTNRMDATEAQVSALLGAVERGTGFVGIHPATKTFLNAPIYFDMLGASLIQHDPFKHFAVKIVDQNHPITQGVEDFEVDDELFVVEGDATKWHVLARAEGHAIIFNKTFGNGRVHYNALGHGSGTLTDPSFQKLVLRAVNWVRSK